MARSLRNLGRLEVEAALLTAALAAAGCASPEAARATAAAAAFAAPADLTARLDGAGGIELHWLHRATAPGGVFVDFNMRPGEEFTTLEIVPARTAAFRHPDVAPGTVFGYRVRPFFGAASDAVGIRTGRAAAAADVTDQEGPLDEVPPAAGAHGLASGGPRASLRSATSLADARPAALTAVLVSPTAADLRWQDRASDEDGYMVEMATELDPEFKTCALLPAGATSFRKALLPPESRCAFRVRAYFCGRPSNVASVATPAQPRPAAAGPGRTGAGLLRLP